MIVVAVGVMLGLAALVVLTVFDAQRRGRRALEKQKSAQIAQLAAGMDERIDGVYDAFEGIVSLPYELTPNSAADKALLENLSRQGGGVTAYMLVDADGTLLAGPLLRDPSSIGKKVDRPGLDELLERGGGAILPTAPGLTTALPTLGIAFAIPDTDGTVRGALLIESEISADSAFNQEVSALGGGADVGEFNFIDQSSVVIASSNPTLIGKPLDDQTLAERSTGLRRENGEVTVVEEVPAAGWRAVFRQDIDDFEGGLGQRVQLAVLLVVIAGLIFAAITVIGLLGRLRAAREEQRRLTEISERREEFVSIVSHELRTPVAGVLGFLQTTLDHWDGMDDAARRQTVARAASNARRLQSLTRDVLDVSSAEQGELRYAFGPVELREEIGAAVATMRELQPERTITFEQPGDPVWANADGDRIVQVLMNLFDNAVTSSPAGSTIDVWMEVEGDEALVSMNDRGAGLSESERDAVFEKFVRGRTGIRGTGLGLYLCRQIVNAHGGRIWAESGAAGGATFRFALPLTPAPQRDAAPASST